MSLSIVADEICFLDPSLTHQPVGHKKLNSKIARPLSDLVGRAKVSTKSLTIRTTVVGTGRVFIMQINESRRVPSAISRLDQTPSRCIDRKERVNIFYFISLFCFGRFTGRALFLCKLTDRARLVGESAKGLSVKWGSNDNRLVGIPDFFN